jgi:Na+/H+ antiporter NhaD/arsenite permease-like protein
MASRDPLLVALRAAGLGLAALAVALRPDAAAAAMRATAGPFATLAAIIIASALAGRLGAFRVLARALVPERGPAAAAAAAVLAFTAVLSALVNLDVAVVVAMPVALQAVQRQHLPAGRLAVAVAMTANATSFLLPTSNITSLLLLHRRPLPAAAYLSGSWLPWILVTAVTVGPLALWAGRRATDTITVPAAGPSAAAVSDLMPMFLIASGIRALLGAGLVLHGGFASQLAGGSALAAAADNLPAAAAVLPATTPGLWAAILATTIGPDLLVTGSVATLISRRIARDAGARLSAWQFTAIGLALVPAQLAAATLGLRIAGVLT